MAIEFHCPQGHRLACPDEMAGRSARCPKCGAKMLVPQPAAAAVSSGAGEGSDVLPADASPLGEGSQPGGDPAASSGSYPLLESGSGVGRESTIVFLCPNGHKLHCPTSMQGQRGKCPHCNVKFIVPTEEDEPEAADSTLSDLGTLLQEPATGGAPSIKAAPGGSKPAGPVPGAAVKSTSATTSAAAAGPTSVAAPSLGAHERRGIDVDFSRIVGGDDAVHEASRGIGEHFQRLWRQRPPGARIELRLASGATLAPDFFAPHTAREASGLFGLHDDHGRLTLAVVAWSSVEQITLHGAAALPEGMSE